MQIARHKVSWTWVRGQGTIPIRIVAMALRGPLRVSREAMNDAALNRG